MSDPKIGDPGTFVPLAFVKYENHPDIPLRLNCRVVYVNWEHGFYTVEGECNGYRIRESFKYIP